MSGIATIVQRDYREHRQTAAFRIMLGVVAAVVLAAAIGISVALSRQPWLDEPKAWPLLELFTGLVLYFLPTSIILAFIWSFANLPVTREKVNGNVECLMATPLTPRDLWLGKTFAIFLPAYIVAVLATVVVMLIVNLAMVLPVIGGFVVPLPALVLGFVINPFAFLGLLLYMILFALANSPDIALAPSLVLGFGLMMGVPALLATRLIDLTTWSFALWSLVAVVAIWITVACLSRLLTKENIVLSSRGE